MGIIRVAVISVVSISLAGCASVNWVEGHALKPAQSVKVATMPVGATASNDYGNSCTTPCSIPLLTDRGGDIIIAMDGYRTERHFVSSAVSERLVAQRSVGYAVEAIDPEPASIALSAIAQLADGKGGIMALDRLRIDSELVPLAQGEEDLLAPATPVTGERIPINLSRR